MLRRRVFKIGNSEAVILGKQVCEFLDLEKGDVVEISELKKVEAPSGKRGGD